MTVSDAEGAIGFVDAAAAVAAVYLIRKRRGGGMSGAFIGLLIALVVEIVRIGIAMSITKEMIGQPTEMLAWLANFRLFNVPILLGLGFAVGMKRPDETPVGAGGREAPMAARQELSKKCPRCAEEVRAEARVCRHCRHEFDEAAVVHAVQQAQAEARAAEEALREQEGKVASQRHQYRRVQLAKVGIIVLVHLGLIVPVVLASMVLQKNRPVSSGPPAALVGAMVLLYAVFGALALWQWRRVKRLERALEAEGHSKGTYYCCKCGKPMQEYYWLHYALCLIVFPYGYLSLLFKLKKCRGCGRPYAAAAATTT